MYRVREEIDEVVGDKTSVEADDLDKLTYMNQVWGCIYVGMRALKACCSRFVCLFVCLFVCTSKVTGNGKPVYGHVYM